MEKQNNRPIGKAWSNGDIEFVAKEFAKEQLHRKSARECAFRIGQRLDKILSAEGKYGKGLLKKFLGELEAKKHVSIKEQTGYGYLHFYRGAGSLERARNLNVPRKYWEVLGTDRWGNDMFSLGLVHWFQRHPLLEDAEGDQSNQIGKQKDKKPSAEKLASVVELLEAYRNILRIIDPDAVVDLKTLFAGPVKQERNGWTSYKMKVPVAALQASAYFRSQLSLIAGEPVRAVPLSMSPMMAKQLGLVQSDEEAWVKLIDRDVRDLSPMPTKTEMLGGHTAKGLARSVHRKAAEFEIVKGAPKPTMQKLEERLKLGDCRQILGGKWISPGSIDMVLTDPPYGVYAPWRESTRVEHHSEGDADKDAAMVAEVASIIVRRKLNRQRFVWLSFCPTDLIHVFAPPLLRAFAPLKPMYQVLIWDKAIKPPSGGIQAFSSQCESILCFSLNRPLPVTQPMSPIYVERQEPYDVHWKPPRLLKRLISEYTYEQGRGGRSSGQIVLDPFCGKGGTGIAALFAGVDFRLIDVHRDQYSDARIEVAKAMGLLKGQKSRETAWVKFLAQAKKSSKAAEGSE